MAGGPESGREQLGRENEGGGVGAEVGEEEGEAVEDHEPNVGGGGPVSVVGDGDAQIPSGHQQEPHALDLHSAHPVDEVDGDPVARDCGAHGHDGLELGVVEGVAENVDVLWWGKVAVVYLGLEQVAAVEYDVHQKPSGGAGEEVAAVAAEEFLRKEGEVWGTGGQGTALCL